MVPAVRAMKLSGPCAFTNSAKSPIVALPLKGLTSTTGSKSAGNPTRFSTGASHCATIWMPPAARNIPTATRIATRYGIIRIATLKPSLAPSTNSSYTFTPRAKA